MMTRMSGRILGAVVGGVAMLSIAAAPALAQQDGQPRDKHEHKDGTKHEKQDKATKGAKVGELAPAFELTDTDGRTVKLEDYKGKVVVLEWFNPDCPVVVKHYDAHTMKTVQDKFRDKGVVWLSINSGAPGQQGHGKERNADARKEWNMNNPVLLDEAGTVGRAYGATNTPHMYVIDGKGTLVYAGAIDDGKPNAPGKTNYVENAIDATLKGETVSPAQTKAYGCGVKYSKS